MQFIKKVGIGLAVFSSMLVLILTLKFEMSWLHPFILLNIGVITMGAGLSTNDTILKASLTVSLVLAIYAAATLPTSEATKATSEALSSLEQGGTPTTIWKKLTD